MTDENSSPAVETVTPVESPAAEVTTSAPAIETPTVETPNVETTVETPASETPAEKPSADTLLGADKKLEDAKPEEKAGESPVKEGEENSPAEEKPAETEVVIPDYEPFTLPEGISFEADKLGEFTKVLGEFENNTKASHEEVQKFGQQLIDRHVEELTRYRDSLTQAWEKQKNDWKDSFVKDPEFSNRVNTVVNSALDAITTYAGDEKHQQEFRDLMETTGVGNHPAMIRLLSNVMLASTPKPLAAPQIASTAKQSKIAKMYGSKK